MGLLDAFDATWSQARARFGQGNPNQGAGLQVNKLMAGALAVLLLSVGCSDLTEGSAVASPQAPQDVWQLADRLVELIPLTADKFEALLGTGLTPDQLSPVRLNGGPVELGPWLHVTSSAIAIIDGTWSFAYVEVAPAPCITEDVVRDHYSAAELTSTPSGHSVYETAVWSTSYDWGSLGFGIREKDHCLTTISLHRA